MQRPGGAIYTGKRNGANTVEANQIRRCAAEGMDAATISDAMRIEESCVQSYIDDFEKNREHYETMWHGEGAALYSQSTSHNKPGGKKMKEYFEKKAADSKEDKLA